MISKKNRTATLISPAIKKLLASVLLVFTTLFTYGQQLHVASYNVRYANPADEQRGNGWSQRCPVICNQIAYESFDLVGMQEVLKSQFDDLSNRLSRDYGCIGVGRNDGKTSGEYAPIFYKKDRFILLDSGCFWLSETPDKPSVGWDAKYPRICSWAQLQDRNTGNTLYFLNTHFDHVGKQARKESACMIVKWIRRHSDCGETILVGDFNVDQRSESYRELVKTGFLTDSFEAAPIRMAATGTVNGFDPQRWTGQRIDHVLVTRGIEVLRYGLLTNPYWSVDCAGNREARLPSDHYPVSVYLPIP